MGAPAAAVRVLARLEAYMARAFEGRDRVVLAFSGGLGSLLLAAVARKRGAVECVVVGTRGAADVGAALVARDFLDYPVEVLQPSPRKVLSTARAIRAADPALSPPDVLSLVPLALVRERCGDEIVLSGFSLAPASPPLRRHLAVAGLAMGRGGPGFRPPSRALALRIAADLGLPDAFARAPRRTPAEGSGVGPSLRAMGHARHVSLPRLLDDLV